MTELSNSEVYQHQPDKLKVAKKKVRLFFTKETADLIEEITGPVDNVVSQNIFTDPILRLQQKNDKTPREINPNN